VRRAACAPDDSQPARSRAAGRRRHGRAGTGCALARRWHKLAIAAENPFVLPEWHAAWVATHPADAPFVLVCREPTGAIAGVVPLVARGRRLLAVGDQFADWFGPACAPADEARVAAAAVAALSRTRRWDVWQLDRCRTSGAWIDGLAVAAVGSAVKLLAHPGDDVLVSVDLARGGPDLRTAKKVRELARSARRLREAHDVVLRAPASPRPRSSVTSTRCCACARRAGTRASTRRRRPSCASSPPPRCCASRLSARSRSRAPSCNEAPSPCRRTTTRA